jgi:hypothetical protein
MLKALASELLDLVESPGDVMGTAMTRDPGPDWRTVYQDVLNETDKVQLTKKLYDLEAAIFFRFQELESSPNPTEVDELKKAVDAMLRIKVEKLGYPMNLSPVWAETWELG